MQLVVFITFIGFKNKTKYNPNHNDERNDISPVKCTFFNIFECHVGHIKNDK